tara:strand:- start:730 stop:1113 length:384 start_codon:yes stop_codon:yes gene_type:complete
VHESIDNDHQKLIDLEGETERQQSEIEQLKSIITEAQQENVDLVRAQSQASIVKIVFLGIVGMLCLTLITAIWSYYSPVGQSSTKGEFLEPLLSYLERVILVLTGILSAVVSGVVDQKGGNGNNKGK